MKKLVLMLALMIFWSGVFGKVKGVEAACSRQVRMDLNSDGIINTSEKKTVEGFSSGESVCDYKSKDDNLNITLAGSETAGIRYICNNDGTTWRDESCNASQVCIDTIDGDGKHAASCKYTDDVTCGVVDVEGKSVTLKINYGVCIDSNNYGICSSDGTIKYGQPCPDGGSCSPKSSGGWVSDTRKFNYNQYALYECTGSCEKYGVTVPEGEQKCFENEILFQKKIQVEECKKGKLEVVDTCDTGESCLEYRETKKVECHSESLSDMCTKLDDGSESSRQTIAGRQVCDGDKLLTCEAEKIPTFTTKDCSLEGKQCYEYASENKAECLTATEAGEKGEGVLVSDTVESKTSIYNPLCDGDKGINTAFGCIPYDATGFAGKFLQILFGIAGGIAFLLMVYGFILVATSSGDEKKLQAAKETITSAITGLLISILALFLFRLIVINILKIPLN